MSAKNSTQPTCLLSIFVRYNGLVESSVRFPRTLTQGLCAVLLLAGGCLPPAAPQVPKDQVKPPRAQPAASERGNPTPSTRAETSHTSPAAPGAQAPTAVTQESLPAQVNQEQAAQPHPSSARSAPTFASPVLWFCLSWVHGDLFSVDCYPTYKQCGAAQRELREGDALVIVPCQARKQAASCVAVYDQDKAETRCFGTAQFCENYGSYVAGNDLERSECREVPTKR